MPKISFLDRLKDRRTILSDGGFGTMCIAKGMQPGECPDILNLTKKEWMSEFAGLYNDAGAEILHAFTFGATSLKLSDYGEEQRMEEINKRAVEIMKDAAGENTYVSASIGPTGKMLKPYGDSEPEELYNSYSEQAQVLLDAGVDLLSIETMIDLQEALLAVQAIRDISREIPVMATMTFDETPRGFYTIMGSPIENVVDGLRNAGATVVGSNCGNGLEKMIKIAADFRKNTDLPILIQSNAGLPETKDGELYYPEAPSFFEDKAVELLNMGIKVVGGCCGTTPEHIRTMKELIDNKFK